MKTLKKLFSVSAIVALLGTLAPMYAFGAGKYSDELEEAYAYAYKHEITTMSSIDNADMYGDLDRIAMAKMLANYAIDVLGLTPDTTKTCTFPDVPASLDKEYDNGVTKACQLGLMGVGITNFNPRGKVTRAEFGTAFSRALNNGSDKLEEMNAANPYYKEHLKYLNTTVSSNGKAIMTDISNPSMKEVRGYVMIMMMRADGSYTPSETCTLEERVACLLGDNAEACLAACTGEPEEPEEPDTTGNGYVRVSRVGSASTQDVAYNAVNKKVGSIKFTAGNEGAKISSIVVKNSGLSDAENISLKLSINGASASKIVTLKTSTDGTTIKFKPALEIKAGKSETVDVYAYLLDDGNATHTITVTDVVVNGKSEGLPIELGTLRTTSYRVYDVENVTLTTPTSAITAGKTNELLATLAFDMPVDGTVNGFTIKRLGKTDLDDAIANVKAYYNNNVVGNVTVSDDEIIVSDLNIKTEADTITIKLKGDAILMDANCDIALYVDLFGIDAVETSTNESMSTVGTWTDSEDEDYDLDDRNEKALDIKGVDLKITKTSNGKQTVAPGASNVVLYEATITSNSEFEVAQYSLTTTATDFNNFRGGKVVLNIDGVSTDLTFAELGNLDDEFTVDANKPVKVKVTANIKETVTTASYTFTFGISAVNNVDGDPITFTAKTTPGDVTEVEKGDLTLSAASEAADASRRLYSNGTDIEVARLNMEAGSQEVTISTVELTNIFEETETEKKLGNNDLTKAISSARLVKVGTDDQISDSCEVEATKITCDMGDYVIEADEDFDVKVLVNIGNADYNVAPFKVEDELRRNLQVKLEIKEGRIGTQERSTKSYSSPVASTYVLGSRPANVSLEKVNSNKFKVTIENKDDNAITLSKFDFRFKPLSGDNYVAEDKYCIRDLGSSVDNCTAATEKFALSVAKGTFTFADLTTMPTGKILEKGKKVSFEVYVDSTYANPSLQGAFLRLETTTQGDDYSIYAE